MADAGCSDEQLSRLLVDNIADYAVLALDPQGRVLSWCAPAERLLGYAAQEAIGRPAACFYTPEAVAADIPAQELRQALTTGRVEQKGWYVRKDGTRFWSSGVTTPLLEADGTLRGFAKVMRDGTAVKQAQNARNDALAYAEAIVETVREPLVVLDGRLRVQGANRAFYRTFQVAPQDTEGRRLYDLGNGQWDIPRLRALLEEMLPRRTTLDAFDVEHDFPGIGRKAMLLNARMLRHADAELILLAIEDVTVRRRAEAERQALETRCTSLVKNIRDHSIFTLDAEGRVTSWNLAAEHILGWTEAQALGRHFSFIFTPEDRQQGLPEAELRTAGAQGRAEDERWHLRKGGERFWALGIVSALHDDDGRLTGYSKILRDMTDRKRIEASLRQSEAHYRSLFDAIDEGFCIIEMLFDEDEQPEDYRFLEVNPAFERLTGLRDVQGKTIRGLVPANEQHWFEIYGRVALTGEPTRFQSHSGALNRWFDVYAWRHGEPQARQVAILFNNITARKQAEDALRASAAQLRALAGQLAQTEQRERKRIAKILHDHLQQLMVAARMQIGTLRRDISAERRGAIAQDVEDILTEALEASRSLVVELSPPILAEAGLIGGLEWLAARMQAQHGLSVRLHTQATAEPAAEDLRLLLFECVRELLLNAVKHAGVAAVDVTLLRTPDNDISVHVRDAGKGFDPDALQVRRGDETGFGLLSIQERLTHLGGRMQIDSGPGRGTQVTLVVPAPSTEPAAETPPAVAAAGSPPTRPRPAACRVLIVDDHPIMRDGLARLFELEADIEVVGEAGDGPEAIAAAEALAPDVVLMDVNLHPGAGAMDGIEATRQILARRPGIKVIGLSMHADQAIADAMRDAGAVAYLTKGGQVDALMETIHGCWTEAAPGAGAA